MTPKTDKDWSKCHQCPECHRYGNPECIINDGYGCMTPNSQIKRLSTLIATLKAEKEQLEEALNITSEGYDAALARFAAIRSKVESMERFEPMIKFTVSATEGMKNEKVFMKKVDYNSGQFIRTDGKWLKRSDVLKILDAEASSDAVPKTEDTIFCQGCARHIPFRRYKRHCEIHRKEMAELRKEMRK